jgi:hypothetical protein
MAQDPVSTNMFIQAELDARISKLEHLFGADAISLNGPFFFGVDDFLRNAIEAKAKKPRKREKLVIVLTTDGGYIEVVQRMVATLRKHYRLVDFIVPNHAYSAGTVLAMSGDAIHMDYYSRLGPIDPQVEAQSGRNVSALGYLARYNKLIERARRGKLTTAEMQVLIQGFDQGDLYAFEQSKQLSIDLLKDWLVRYKFKDWSVTETRKKKVTRKMKERRAAEIAKNLSDPEIWHVHGYGISMDVLTKDLNVLIDDFGKDAKRTAAIRGYHDLLADYMVKLSTKGVIHFAGSYSPYLAMGV